MPSSKWSVSGDLRLRYEYNAKDDVEPAWDRFSLRARLAADYRISNEWTLGGRLATGHPDNPRTTDNSAESFDDYDFADFDAKVDRAFLAFRHERVFLTAGRFAHPFNITDMVWDPDANPQGLAGSYEMLHDDDRSARVAGMFFPIDSDIYRGGSDMLGGQLTYSMKPGTKWGMSVNASYYDYRIVALNPTSPGGARGNNLQPGTLSYLSDFDLLDAIFTVTYAGFGERWPVKVQGSYVKNLGAAVDEDRGFSIDIFAGTIKAPGRFSIRYGYSQVEKDAVLGVYSNDNIIYATNYELHAFSLEFPLWGPTYLGFSHAIYRHLDPELAPGAEGDWVSRTRLMFHVTF